MPTTDAHVIYNRYSENAARLATITLSGCTAETGYSVDNLVDGVVARPLRLVETSGRIVFDFGSDIFIALIALFHCNFQEGLTVLIEANATNSWAGPSFSQAITIPAWTVYRYPGNPWLMLDELPGWGAYRYWSISIGSNACALTLGEVWMSESVRRLNPDFAPGRRPAFDQPLIEHTTAYRKLRTQIGKVVRSVTGQIPPTDDDVVQDVLDWITDANGRMFLFIPDGLANEAWPAIHTTTRQEIEDLLDHDASTFPLTIEEDGRGIEPTPSPLP